MTDFDASRVVPTANVSIHGHLGDDRHQTAHRDNWLAVSIHGHLGDDRYLSQASAQAQPQFQFTAIWEMTVATDWTPAPEDLVSIHGHLGDDRFDRANSQ